MRTKAMAVAAGVLGAWLVSGEAAHASPADGRIESDGRIERSPTVTFRLATTAPTRGFDRLTHDGETLFVAPAIAFTSADLVSAVLARGGDGMELTLTAEAAQAFTAESQAAEGDRLAIFDGRAIVAAPSIQSVLSDGRVMLGDLDSSLAARLVNLLSSNAATTADAVVSVVAARKTALPGGLVTVDVYVSNVANLAAYQVALSTSGGRTGSLTVADFATDERADYVFGSASVIKASDPTQFSLVGVMVSGGVDVDEESAAYIGSYTLRVSPEAEGTFTVNVDFGQETLLRDANARAIAYRPGRPATITIGAKQKPTRSR